MAFRNGTVIAMAQQQQAAESARAEASDFRLSLAASINNALVRVTSSSGRSQRSKKDKDGSSSSGHMRSSSLDFGSLTRLRRSAFQSSKERKEAAGETGAARRIYYDEAELLLQPPSFLEMNEDDKGTTERTGLSRYNIFSGSNGRFTFPRRRKSVSKVVHSLSKSELTVDVNLPARNSVLSLADTSLGDCLNSFPDVPLRRTNSRSYAVSSNPLEVALWRQTDPVQVSGAPVGQDVKERTSTSIRFATPPRSNVVLPFTSSAPSLSPRSTAASDSTFSTPSSRIISLEKYAVHDSVAQPVHARSFSPRRPDTSSIPPRSSPPSRPLPHVPSQSLEYRGLYAYF